MGATKLVEKFYMRQKIISTKHLFIKDKHCMFAVNKDNMEEFVGIRMSTQLKKSLQKLADTDKRKLADFIRIELEKIVEQSKTKK